MGEPRRRVRGERVQRGRRRDVVQGEAAAARRTLVDIEAVGGKEVLRHIWDGDARERIELRVDRVKSVSSLERRRCENIRLKNI